MTEFFPAYIVSSEAWYASALTNRTNELNIQFAASDGGCKWEFIIRARPDITADAIQACVFDDAFQAFADVPEFFAAIGSTQPQSLAEVRDILEAQGFKDITERSRK